MATLQFLGAAGTVTGSKYLLTSGRQKILIDCGLFQGDKTLQSRNWNPFPIPPNQLNAVFITHAHLDHTGYLPKLVALGFTGKIYATPSTIDLLSILLLDSAHLQEEEARFHAQLKGCCPLAKPLYTVENANETLKRLSRVNFNTPLELENLSIDFVQAGHILGSAFIRVRAAENGRTTVIVFSGDMGRYDSPILNDPTSVSEADYLLVESTYGNRIHEHILREDSLLPAVEECIKRSGCLLIPAFTVGRTQEVLYALRRLLDQKKISPLPVTIDSPMAVDVTRIYEAHHDEHDAVLEAMEKQGRSPFHFPMLRYARTVEESKALNKAKGPMIIISANGMCTGGRIMHHLVKRLPDPSTVLLFVGYQAEGTRGRQLLEGAKSVKIFHQDIPVAAAILEAAAFSAHGDYPEILRWLSGFTKPPLGVFLVHGEADAREGLKGHILEKYPHWNVSLPGEMETTDLTPSPGAG